MPFRITIYIRNNLQCSYFRQFVLFLAFLVNGSISTSDSKYPLCIKEGCQCTISTVLTKNVVDVTCTTIKNIDLSDVTLWIDVTKNETYPYHAVSLTENTIIDLAKTIPTSELTYLNLANNDINSIGDSVFQNLQNMSVLILSHNDLEIIHPDAFKVRITYL